MGFGYRGIAVKTNREEMLKLIELGLRKRKIAFPAQTAQSLGMIAQSTISAAQRSSNCRLKSRLGRRFAPTASPRAGRSFG